MLRSLALAVAVTVATASPAFADARLFWMNDLVLDSRAGVAFGVGNPPVADSLTVTTDLYGKFDVARRMLLSFRLPVALSFFDEPGNEGTGGALGNIALGLTGVKALRSGSVSLRLGGGGVLYLPTASDGPDASLATANAFILNLPDPGRWLDATTVRARGDFLLRAGIFFFQSELNLDVFFRDGDDDIDLMVGLGPGIDVSRSLSLILELSLVDIDDDSTTIVDAGIRYRGSSLELGARLYFPTEEIAGESVIGAGLDLGARF